MTQTCTRARLAEHDEELLFLEPETFDEAIIGLAERAGGMSREDAEEFFEFNTAGAWVGEHTPVFIDTRYAE